MSSSETDHDGYGSDWFSYYQESEKESTPKRKRAAEKSEENSTDSEPQRKKEKAKECNTPTKKKVKCSALKGAATYKSVYKRIWENEFPITAANRNKHAFHCLPCKITISCSHMGKADVKKHCDSSAHKEMEKAVKSSRSIQSMFGPGNSNLAEKTVEAEVLNTNFIVQHNAFLDC